MELIFVVILETSKQVFKAKKPVKNVKKKQTLPVSENACGQFVFPITLNDLTVHSLGEVRYTNNFNSKKKLVWCKLDI